MGTSLGCCGAVEDAATAGAAEFEFLLLDATISDEGAEDQGVGDGCCGEDLERCHEGAELLVRLPLDRCVHAVDGDADEDGREAE